VPGAWYASGMATAASLGHSQRHALARQLKAQVTWCEWRLLGHCLGPLDVAHLDGDDTNNTPGNLRKLCRSHHALHDRGRINPQRPAQPGYWTDNGGKRRYLHPSPSQSPLGLPDHW
jgi:hypothetical protein